MRTEQLLPVASRNHHKESFELRSEVIRTDSLFSAMLKTFISLHPFLGQCSGVQGLELSLEEAECVSSTRAHKGGGGCITL